MDILKLTDYFKVTGQPAFRLKQLKQAYYVDSVTSYNEVFTLPKSLREQLVTDFPFSSVIEKTQEHSTDGRTHKALLRLPDGDLIETVLMNYDNWQTVCLSVMVGCPLGCLFCATGKLGFKRNLTAEEIVDQVVYWNRYLHSPRPLTNQLTNKLTNRVSHLVFMGMGEPFLNWDNLWQAIDIIQDKDGLNIGDRKISISTAGITPKIGEFVAKNTQINLAISLHAPTQITRQQLMPITEKYPLPELLTACLDYVAKTKRKLFFEYALINGVNDSITDANRLADLMWKSYLFHLNLIQLNPTDGVYCPSTPERQKAFIDLLTKRKVPFTIRHSFGTEISAACGQLADNK